MSEKMCRWLVLCRDVIVVASEGEIKDWACYIGAVEGINHEHEWQQVRDHGCKLPKSVAEALANIFFPEFLKLKYRA